MASKNPEPVSELIQMREPWRTLISGRFFFVFEQHGVLAVLQGGWKSYLQPLSHQGWWSEEGKGEGYIQRGAAEAVQQDDCWEPRGQEPVLSLRLGLAGSTMPEVLARGPPEAPLLHSFQTPGLRAALIPGLQLLQSRLDPWPCHLK